MTDELQLLQQRIERLAPPVAEFQNRLTNVLQVSTRPEDALTLARGIAESLTKRLLQDIGRNPPSTFESCLRELEKPEVMSLALVPSEVVSVLHVIRVLGNKATHESLRITCSIADVCLILQALLRVVGWYFTEFGRGPRLTSIFQEPPDECAVPSSSRPDRESLEKLLTLVQGWHDEVVQTVAHLDATTDPRERRRIEFVYLNTRKYLPQVFSIRRLLENREGAANLRTALDAFLALLTVSSPTSSAVGLPCSRAETFCRPPTRFPNRGASCSPLTDPLLESQAANVLPPSLPADEGTGSAIWTWLLGAYPALTLRSSSVEAEPAQPLPPDRDDNLTTNLARLQAQLQAITDEVIPLLSNAPRRN